jgi:hypothetical protein
MRVAVGQASMETLGCLRKERAKPTTKSGLAVATTRACRAQFACLNRPAELAPLNHGTH